MSSPDFIKLLNDSIAIHEKKSKDYASESNPFRNFDRQEVLMGWFTSDSDKSMAGIVGQKLARLAELSEPGKTPANESIEDTELDLLTYVGLWMARRRLLRKDELTINEKEDLELYVINHEAEYDINMLYRVAAYIEAVIDSRKRVSAHKSEHPHQS